MSDVNGCQNVGCWRHVEVLVPGAALAVEHGQRKAGIGKQHLGTHIEARLAVMRQQEVDQCTEEIGVSPQPGGIAPIKRNCELLARLLRNGVAAQRGVEQGEQALLLGRDAISVEVEAHQPDGERKLHVCRPHARERGIGFLEPGERALEDGAHLVIVQLFGLGIERNRKAEEGEHHLDAMRGLEPVAVHVLRQALDRADELRRSQCETQLIIARVGREPRRQIALETCALAGIQALCHELWNRHLGVGRSEGKQEKHGGG